MQILDLNNKDTLGTMYFPETSLKDGKVHGFPIPLVSRAVDQWLLSMWWEPRFNVYKQEGEKLIYQKTVELDVPNWVGYSPVDPAQTGTFFDQMQKVRTASLEDILIMDE